MTRSGDDFDDVPLPQVGGIGAMPLPFEMTDEEAEELLAEIRVKEGRRRPPGFAPWPEDARPELRIVA